MRAARRIPRRTIEVDHRTIAGQIEAKAGLVVQHANPDDIARNLGACTARHDHEER
jgi:hypothetical protein